ncbi:MAG: hypothetical protein R3C56_24295 [Pirellulaceae bacterium]
MVGTALGRAGVVLFWMFMAGPIVLIYREYFVASYHVLSGEVATHLEDFPHPTPALLFTSLLLSLLPLAIYCMVVLTLAQPQKGRASNTTSHRGASASHF